MALFGRDYDETYRGRPWSDRGFWGRSGTPMRPYQGDYGYGTYGTGTTGRKDFDRFGYDRDFRGHSPGTFDRGYDRGYKSRWQTDYGDPFGDRQQHTPMRVIRGDARHYDQSFWNNDVDWNRTHYPFGYKPYSARAGYDTGYDNSRSHRNFGYDRGWF
jgi:hypothetical protein